MPLPPQAIQLARSAETPDPKATTNVVTLEAGSRGDDRRVEQLGAGRPRASAALSSPPPDVVAVGQVSSPSVTKMAKVRGFGVCVEMDPAQSAFQRRLEVLEGFREGREAAGADAAGTGLGQNIAVRRLGVAGDRSVGADPDLRRACGRR